MIQVRNLLIVLGCITAFVGLGLLVYATFNAGRSQPVPAAIVLPKDSAGPDTEAPGNLSPAAALPVVASSRSPDRTTCAQIRGTDYASEAERQWFAANCVSEAPASLVVAPARAPGGSFASSLAPLKDSYLGQVKFLVDLLAEPKVKETDWRISVIQGVQNIKALGVRIRDLQAPSCQLAADVAVLSGVLQVDTASTVLATAVQKQDAAPLGPARTSLQNGAEAVSRAAAVVQTTRC